MRIISWNVNGIRAAVKKGFATWLDESGADIVGLQEVRAREDQLPKELTKKAGWHRHIVAAERGGYSGVGLFTRQKPDEIQDSLGVKAFDDEGRIHIARFGKLRVANVYFPNGSGQDRDNSRIPYKLKFKRKVFDTLQPYVDAGEPVFVMGDFNVAHEEIDLARPKQNHDTAGFTDLERKEMTRWLKAGWVDTFRHFEKGGEHYSWWAQRQDARARNVGWRIDYVLASPGAMRFVKSAAIHPQILGSDHCPVSVDVDAAIIKAKK